MAFELGERRELGGGGSAGEADWPRHWDAVDGNGSGGAAKGVAVVASGPLLPLDGFLGLEGPMLPGRPSLRGWGESPTRVVAWGSCPRRGATWWQWQQAMRP
jgi:hypothetical protein